MYTEICCKEWLIGRQVPRPAGLVARLTTPGVNVSESKGRTFPSYSWWVSPFVLFGPSTDWMRPTHTGECNLLY